MKIYVQNFVYVFNLLTTSVDDILLMLNCLIGKETPKGGINILVVSKSHANKRTKLLNIYIESKTNKRNK